MCAFPSFTPLVVFLNLFYLSLLKHQHLSLYCIVASSPQFPFLLLLRLLLDPAAGESSTRLITKESPLSSLWVAAEAVGITGNIGPSSAKLITVGLAHAVFLLFGGFLSRRSSPLRAIMCIANIPFTPTPECFSGLPLAFNSLPQNIMRCWPAGTLVLSASTDFRIDGVTSLKSTTTSILPLIPP